MDKIYIIDYDNDGLYEDHVQWISECFFKSKEDAVQYLQQCNFEKSDYAGIEGFYDFQRFEENEWWEYTYAKIKELELCK